MTPFEAFQEMIEYYQHNPFGFKENVCVYHNHLDGSKCQVGRCAKDADQLVIEIGGNKTLAMIDDLTSDQLEEWLKPEYEGTFDVDLWAFFQKVHDTWAMISNGAGADYIYCPKRVKALLGPEFSDEYIKSINELTGINIILSS